MREVDGDGPDGVVSEAIPVSERRAATLTAIQTSDAPAPAVLPTGGIAPRAGLSDRGLRVERVDTGRFATSRTRRRTRTSPLGVQSRGVVASV